MKWVGTAILLVLAAFFGLLALGQALMLDEARETWAGGKRTDGTLVAIHTRKSTQSYTYTYAVEGREYTAEKRGVPWAARDLRPGAKLDVRYDPLAPETSFTPAEMQELENWGNRAFLPVVAVALLVGAVYVAARGRRKRS